jgi:hypothetical protein
MTLTTYINTNCSRCVKVAYVTAHGTMYQNVSGFVCTGAQGLDTYHVFLCLWKLSSLALMAENMPACLLGCDTVFWVSIF